MPCMCGDVCCWSCGPAQGNWKCPMCGEWASEGCKHISIKTGKLKLRYQKTAEQLSKIAAEEDEAFAQQLREDEALYDKAIDDKIDEWRETGRKPSLPRRKIG